MSKLNKKDQKKMVYSTCNHACNLIMLFYLVIRCCNLIMSYIKAMVSPYLKFLVGCTSAMDLQCNIGDAHQDHGIILMAHKSGGF